MQQNRGNAVQNAILGFSRTYLAVFFRGAIATHSAMAVCFVNRQK
jgi:hypothetical protein